MIIKNNTQFTKESMEGAMRASNFDNNRYKFFKLVYNLFGLLFGMMFVRYLVLRFTGRDEADTFMEIFYAAATALFLYIGMVGIDKSQKKRFESIYSRMIGVTFSYEIDSENIVVYDEEESDTISWDEVIKWQQDDKNFYLFVSDDNCLVISKDGFVDSDKQDMKELLNAIMGLRNLDNSESSKVDIIDKQ